jgi:hypothetical protein
LMVEYAFISKVSLTSTFLEDLVLRGLPASEDSSVSRKRTVLPLLRRTSFAALGLPRTERRDKRLPRSRDS